MVNFCPFGDGLLFLAGTPVSSEGRCPTGASRPFFPSTDAQVLSGLSSGPW